MSFGGVAGGTAASVAATQAARARRLEEERMTPYGKNDLDDGWEFKILRSNFAAFDKPERFRAALEAESKAGWILVEKFDGSRVRLKRPADARSRDAGVDFDAYRTQLPGETARIAWLVGGLIAALAVMVVVLLALR